MFASVIHFSLTLLIHNNPIILAYCKTVTRRSVCLGRLIRLPTTAQNPVPTQFNIRPVNQVYGRIHISNLFTKKEACLFWKEISYLRENMHDTDRQYWEQLQ